MTRLITEWISDMENTVATWDEQLKEKTGSSFIEIASKASGRREEKLLEARKKLSICVVPITSGEGVIGHFAQSVAAIINEMGFKASVTDNTDVSGIYQAQCQDADMVYVADDNRYIAMNLREKAMGENDKATARGYVEALEGILLKNKKETLENKDVLLLGYGRVGHEMYSYLKTKKATVTVYDSNKERQDELIKENKKIIDDPNKIKEYKLIMDATSTGNWISEDMLNEDALISAPGIPFSLDEKARAKYEEQSIHDNLEIGTAVMLAMAMGEKL